MDYAALAVFGPNGLTFAQVARAKGWRVRDLPLRQQTGASIGGVAVVPARDIPKGLRPLKSIDERVSTVDRLVRMWPQGLAAVQALIGQIQVAEVGRPGVLGCIGEHYAPSDTQPAPAIRISLDDPLGGAAGVFHETSHLQLSLLGLNIELSSTTAC
jgi:hypothetical protein